VIGTFHHVSEQHLHRYLAEFDFRYNNRSGLGVEDGRPLKASRASVSRTAYLTKPRTLKQKARAFMRWRNRQ
jgi:ISXO2-like transposase domain